MPIQVTCPSCQGMFNAPDSAGGKRAKCPTCGGVIQIPTPAPVQEVLVAEPEPVARFADDDFDVEPPAALPMSGATAATAMTGDRKQCPMCGEMIARTAIKCRFCGEVLDKSMEGMLRGPGDASDPGWRKVRTGLATIYYSIATMFLALLLMVIGGAVAGAMGDFQPGGEPGAGFFIVIGLGGIVILGAAIGMIVGQALCASVPQHSGAKGFAVGALVCMVVNIALSMIGNAGGSEAISGIGGLISMVGYILFILFIRRSAEYLNNHDLAASATRFLIFGVAMFIGAIMIGVFAAVAAVPVIVVILGLALLIGGLVAFVWYMRLISGLMATIG